MTRIQIADIAPSESALLSDVTNEELQSINGGLLGGLLNGVLGGVVDGLLGGLVGGVLGGIL